MAAQRLTDLLARAGFPLFGVHPRVWEGPAFLGEVDTDARGVRSVAFVYLDQIDGSTMGASVSNIAAGEAAGSPLEAHAVPFIARFDPGFLLGRMKRKRFMPFARDEVVERAVTAAVAGETLGGTLITHRGLPVQLLRVAKRVGNAITDLGIVTWRLSAVEFAKTVQPVDARFAKEFDAPHGEPYPPPEWGTPAE